ncbi:MAG: Gfo/Idh/MocA family oxidoreductase [Opitutaceae bacterium]|nr:Gfo/Idh/MocA family oxidoreductase [Opitutaceae bacterium]
MAIPSSPWNRRRFLGTAALATTAGLAGRLRAAANLKSPASDAVRIGIIGLSTKGADHLKNLLATPGARIAALCDVDPRTLAAAVSSLPAGIPRPFTTTDARLLLERNDVDAVVIATPNHWHGLLTIWALQSGKHVYVEKPMSHTVHEGRAMIEAANSSGRVVQVGTQRRTDAGLAEAGEFIRSGRLGRITHIHTVYYSHRTAVKETLPWYPDWLDYDRFCGPSPVVPLKREKLHYDWHWMWDTGNGELGNNGVHVLDLALALVKQNRPPRRVMALGGRYVVNDVAETPNSMFVLYDYEDCPIFFESRGLPARSGVTYSDNYLGIRVGTIVHCEGGYLTALTGASAYDSKGKLVRKFNADGGSAHMSNFLDAVRRNSPSSVNAPPSVGHLSASVCHYGNISYRLGTPAAADSIERRIASFNAADPLLKSFLVHLRANGVDPARQPLTVGPWLTINDGNDDIVGLDPDDPDLHNRARFLLHESARPPYLLRA